MTNIDNTCAIGKSMNNKSEPALNKSNTTTTKKKNPSKTIPRKKVNSCK